MRATFVCSECGRQQQAEERNAAMGIRCPRCHAFMDPAAPGTAAATSLNVVGKGLALVYAGLCLFILAVILVALAALAVQNVLPQISARWLALLFGSILILFMASIVADIVGRFLCLAVPSEDMAAKALAALSVVFSLAALALWGWQATTLLLARPGPSEVLTYLPGPLSLIGNVLFLLFLRSLALYVRRPDLARWAILVLVIGAVTFAAETGLIAWGLAIQKPLFYSIWALGVVVDRKSTRLNSSH